MKAGETKIVKAAKQHRKIQTIQKNIHTKAKLSKLSLMYDRKTGE